MKFFFKRGFFVKVHASEFVVCVVVGEVSISKEKDNSFPCRVSLWSKVQVFRTAVKP